MLLSFIKEEYDGNESCVSWQGLSLCIDEEFRSFMQRDVAERLKDTQGIKDFEDHLRGLALTEMGKENLEAILNAAISEERDWAIGEALAEALLICIYQVVFPWNIERDKRNVNGSLPGADIIGFLPHNSGYRLVLGEVKTSSEEKYPPSVMSGRSGLVHQIDKLAQNLSTIYQLLKWLQPRCKGNKYEEAFNKSVALYLNSGNKAVSLFGVLIRDTKPNKFDLEARGKALGTTVLQPTSIDLIAVYLPCKITDLLSQIEGGGAA